MAEHTLKSRRPRHTPDASTRIAARHTAPSLERRPAATALGSLQAALNESPRGQATPRLQRALNQSPRVATLAQLSAVLQQRTGTFAAAQRQATEDDESLQGKFETAPRATEDRAVAQRVGGYDDDYDDYDDYDDEEDQDVDDPDLAEYLTIPEKPTLWDFLTPNQQQDVAKESPAEKKKKANAEQRQRQLEKSHRRKPNREKRAGDDKDEHEERRRLGAEAGSLLDEVEGLEAALSAACRNAKVFEDRLGDRKGRAGRYSHLIKGKDPQVQWETRKSTINALGADLKGAASNARPVIKALTDVGYTNLFVRTDVLETKIAAMNTFKQDSPAHQNILDGLLTQAEGQVTWLDALIAEGNPAAAPQVIQYPHVRIHKCIKKCPLYINIPFAELEAQTATGTHGKSARDAYVHKKVSGGIAITITYRGPIAYVTDWGPKDGNSNKYVYQRGGTAYDSGATYNLPSEFLPV